MRIVVTGSLFKSGALVLYSLQPIAYSLQRRPEGGRRVSPNDDSANGVAAPL